MRAPNVAVTVPDAPSAIQEAAVFATSRATAQLSGNSLWRNRWPNPWLTILHVATTIEDSAVQAMGDEP